MRRGRLTALAGAGAAALAAGVWFAVARLENPGAPLPGTAASGPVAAAATFPTPGPSGGLPGDGSAATSADRSARRAARPSPHAPAAPFVQRFAAQPGVRPLAPRRSPTATVPVRANVDGCDHNYGEKTQCVPAQFPPDVTDKCDWLEERGFKSIRVVGTDRQKLDEDHDRVACNT
jgi:hypothetical protein